MIIVGIDSSSTGSRLFQAQGVNEHYVRQYDILPLPQQTIHSIWLKRNLTSSCPDRWNNKK